MLPTVPTKFQSKSLDVAEHFDYEPNVLKQKNENICRNCVAIKGNICLGPCRGLGNDIKNPYHLTVKRTIHYINSNFDKQVTFHPTDSLAVRLALTLLLHVIMACRTQKQVVPGASNQHIGGEHAKRTQKLFHYIRRYSGVKHSSWFLVPTYLKFFIRIVLKPQIPSTNSSQTYKIVRRLLHLGHTQKGSAQWRRSCRKQSSQPFYMESTS